MSEAVKITRVDLSATELRKLSKKEQNPLIARRMLAIALVLDGRSGVQRQRLVAWLHHYNKARH